MEAATVDDLQWVAYPADASDDQAMQGWMLRVIGKGQKEREVPVPSDVVGELAKYMVLGGLDADPEDIGNQGPTCSERPAMPPSARQGSAAGRSSTLGRASLRRPSTTQIKAYFADCASVLRGQGDAKGGDRFERASTHWMRHSHASHAIAGGMPTKIAQHIPGHVSLATTTVYVTTEKRRRMKAVEAFWRKKERGLGGQTSHRSDLNPPSCRRRVAHRENGFY